MLSTLKYCFSFLANLFARPITAFLAWRKNLRDEEMEKLKQENEVLKHQVANLVNAVNANWTSPLVYYDRENESESHKERKCRRRHARELSDSELMGGGEDP